MIKTIEDGQPWPENEHTYYGVELLRRLGREATTALFAVHDLQEMIRAVESQKYTDVMAPEGKVFLVKSDEVSIEVSYRQHPQTEPDSWTPRHFQFGAEFGGNTRICAFVADRILLVKPAFNPVQYTEVQACSPDGQFRYKIEEDCDIQLCDIGGVPTDVINAKIGKEIADDDAKEDGIPY